MVYATTTRLVGLDPSTGAQRWSFSLADDSQGVPATVVGGVVVVAQASGQVLGLDPTTGRERWADRVPAGCRVMAQGGLVPGAAVVPGIDSALLAYDCADTQVIVRVNPATGARLWSLPLAGMKRRPVPDRRARPRPEGVIGLLLISGGGRHLQVSAGRRRRLALVAATKAIRSSRSMRTVARRSGEPTGYPVQGDLRRGRSTLRRLRGYGIGCYAAGRAVRRHGD